MANVSNVAGVPAMAREQLAKHEAEGVKLQKEATWSDACRVVLAKCG